MANNPAGRLHEIFRAMLGVSKDRLQKPAYEVFREILCSTEHRADVVLPRIARVLELPSIVAHRIEKIDRASRQQFLSWTPTVIAAFNTQNFTAPFKTFVAPIDDNTMSLLAFCDQALSSHAPEPTVSQETLDRMRADLQVFFGEVRSADLDEQLREYVLHYIDLIDRALIDYRIMGFDAITHGIAQAGGVLFTQKASAEQVMKTPLKPKFIAAFFGLVAVCSGYPGAKLILGDMNRLVPEFAEEAEVEPKQETTLPAATLPAEVETIEATQITSIGEDQK